MKNFLQPGISIDVAAPADVASGKGVRLLNLFGIASTTVKAGEQVAIGTEGVYEVDKLVTDVMSVGQKLNWDNGNAELKLAGGDLDKVATVVEAAGNGATTVKAKLTPV